MKKIYGALLLVGMSILIGCTSTRALSYFADFPADGSKYEVLGRITVDIPEGSKKGTYTALVDLAREMYPTADDVVNLVVDAKKAGFGGNKFFVFSGVAIRYTDIAR